MTTKKVLLSDLKASDLKKELEERDLEASGKKSVLQQRLSDDLMDKREDPKMFQFEIAADLGAVIEKRNF